MTLQEANEQIAWLEDRMSKCKQWGAALSVMDEEWRGLKRWVSQWDDEEDDE